MPDLIYVAQCLNGHYWHIERGSDLERRAIAREASGYLDAICLDYKECPDCQEEREICDRRVASLLDW